MEYGQVNHFLGKSIRQKDLALFCSFSNHNVQRLDGIVGVNRCTNVRLALE